MTKPRELLDYFEYGHLPEPMRSVAKAFHTLAHLITLHEVTDPRERHVALRKLLEAKDAAVRSVLPVDE